MRRRALRLPALWLLFLLTLPGVAWTFGARQPLLENRPKVEVPELSVPALGDGATFKQLDQAVLDRLPLRKEAIDANARVNVDVFRDSPNPDVAIGDDGWLYFVPQLQACRAAPPLADPADAAAVLALGIRASGRRAIVAVPGGKLTLHPEHAPDIDAAAEACVRALERRIAKRLAATPGALDVDGELAALVARGRSVFLKGDTHWNATGRERFVRRVLDAIRPGLARETGLRRGPVIDRPADLWQMLGIGRTDRDATVIAARSPKRAPKNVLLMGDSQLEFALTRPPAPGVRPLVERVLPGAAICGVLLLVDATCDQPLVDARTVVYEMVGRNVQSLTSTCWRPLSLYARDMRGRPARLEHLDGRVAVASRSGRLVLAPGEVRQIRVRPASDEHARPRLLLIPVLKGSVGVAQAPQAGGPAPCASPIGDAGGLIVLPVPAGRRATDLVLELASTSGARLGRPREIRDPGDRPATRTP